MKNLFSLDNPFMQMLSHVADFILQNLLFLLCSLPVVTMGASIAALHKVMQDVVFDADNRVCSRFFSAFKENFKQATAVWLGTLVVCAALAADAILIHLYFRGALAGILYALLIVLAVVVIGTLNYLFPLMVRYSNTVKEHVCNAVILAVCKLPRTLLLCLLTLLPVLLLFFAPMTFVMTLIFWVVVGFSVVVYLKNVILKPVYLNVEAVQRGEGSITIMK